VLGCVVRFSIVWCTGRVFDFVRMKSGYALRALAVSAIISVVLAFAHVGLVRSVQGGVHSQDGQLWAGQRWSDMNNMYGWLAENTCRGAGRLQLDGSLHFLSFTTAHSEGGLGMGMKGSGSMLFHVRAFGWVSLAGFGIVHILTCLV